MSSKSGVVSILPVLGLAVAAACCLGACASAGRQPMAGSEEWLRFQRTSCAVITDFFDSYTNNCIERAEQGTRQCVARFEQLQASTKVQAFRHQACCDAAIGYARLAKIYRIQKRVDKQKAAEAKMRQKAEEYKNLTGQEIHPAPLVERLDKELVIPWDR